MRKIIKQIQLVTTLLFINSSLCNSQFIDHFDSMNLDEGWTFFSGDGNAEIDFYQGKKHGIITVDATNDKLNIWWALIKKQVSGLDMDKLVQKDYELRVEAKIKTSHAPRRVNLHFNHQRTTDFHSVLKEYDIPDTDSWHVISMTTKNFDVQKGDKINVQMALMDWGMGKYQILVDYVKVDVVDAKTAKPDLGDPQTYHPTIPSLNQFENHIEIKRDVCIDKEFATYNFHEWTDPFDSKKLALLPVSHNQIIIMKTDLTGFKGKTADGLGVLEMHIHHLERAPNIKKDFGMIRLVEILGGKENWQQETVTYESFLENTSPEDVFNGQMIIDTDLSLNKDRSVFFGIPKPVIQRLIDGKTKGLAIFPLGAVQASFYGSENCNESLRPKLHFNLK